MRNVCRKKNRYFEELYSMADPYLKISLLDLRTGISRLIKADREEMKYMNLLGLEYGKEIDYDEWMKRFVKELIHPDYREEFTALFNMESLRDKFSSRGSRQSMVYQCRRRIGGEYYWVQAEYVARRQDEWYGEILCCVTDINDQWIHAEKKRRELEEELQQLNKELRNKTEFLERSSQELRMTVSAIVGMNQLALGSVELGQPDMTRHYLTLAGGMAKQLMSVLTDVIDISQIQRTGLSLVCECFDIHHLSEYCREYIHYLDIDKRISFMWTGRLRGYYMGDEKRICTALFNVIENAIRYNRAGGDIRILSEQITGVGTTDLFIIHVRDTGNGMSAEQQRDIFTPFSRGRNLLPDRQQGLGIGLSVAKHILNAMGGSIHINSEPGAGTEVMIRFSLPRAQEVPVEMPVRIKHSRQKNPHIQRQAYETGGLQM